MEEITDPKIIEEFKKKQTQFSGIEGLSLGNEITDPKIIEQFSKQKKINKQLKVELKKV
jgi:hypothetical protein